MKYLWLTVLAVVIWSLVDYLMLHTSIPGRVPIMERLKALAQSTHRVAGWLAILILIILALRLLVYTLIRQ